MDHTRALRCALSLDWDNPLVDDHRVHGVRTLPGVAFLDLVCRALAEDGVDLSGVELREVLFTEPVVTTEGVGRELLLTIEPDGDGSSVTVVSRRVPEGGEPEAGWTTHVRARLRRTTTPLTGDIPDEPATPVRDVDECYAAGRAAGVAHSSYMRCHGTLRAQGGRIVSHIRLGEEAASADDGFLLHPALLDGATMQAYAEVFSAEDADGRPLIPLHVNAFRAAGPLGAACSVDLRLAEVRAGADVVRADLDLRSDSGEVIARLSGLTYKRVRSTSAITGLTGSARPVVDTPVAAPAPVRAVADGALVDALVELVRATAGDPALVVEPDRGFYELGLESTHLLALVRAIEVRFGVELYPTLLFEHPTVDDVAEHLRTVLPAAPTTGAVEVPAPPGRTGMLTGLWQSAPAPTAPRLGTTVVVGDAPELVRALPGRVVTAPLGADFGALFADLDPDAVFHVFPAGDGDVPAAVGAACAQVIALAKSLARKPNRTPLVHVSATPTAAAVAGLARTARVEHPRLAVTAVECDGVLDPTALLAEAGEHGEHWVRHDGGRLVRRYSPFEGSDSVRPKPGAVYLITGGAGGIGRAVSTWLTGAGARVVVAGRTEPATALPAGVESIRADVTSKSDVDSLVAGVLARHGRLDGLVHAAGVLRDGLLTGVDADDLAAVLAPKVTGISVLEAATAGLDLDFRVVFSSVTGVAGNAGQSCYGAANAFCDAHARAHGWVSLAWPLWAEGGMSTDAATEAVFGRQGQVPLPTPEGIAATAAALGAAGREVVVLHGDPQRVAESLGLRPADPPRPAPATSAARAAEPVAAGAEPIAIVGLAGRYPMAENVDAFWDNLVSGRDCVTEVPPDRWDLAGFYSAERAPGRSYAKWGGFLDEIADFDPGFFRITPREAAGMDPQERLFLQAAWHAMEDAGTTRADLAGTSVGVFAGVMFTQYQMLGLTAPERLAVLPTSFSSAVANRLSYFLDLRGPSLSVDTMCSSSLTALHLACESLRSGDCDAAFAGGVNVIVHPYKYLHLSQVGFVSTDGRCRAFGAGGDGYVPGEGVGVVLLKRLSRAVADGDRVHAVITGSAVNHGGRAAGFFAPGPAAQSAVVRRALDRAGLAPADIGYLEAHGTGTELGDPIEVSALTAVFGTDTEVPVGSVKTGIGHLESAAGIAGLTKVLLQMRHRTLAPSLHAEPANAAIDFSATPLRVQRTAEPWSAKGNAPLRAGISAFGAGGANAHVVVEQRPDHLPPGTAAPGPHAVLLSARTPVALRALAERYLRMPAGADVLPEVLDLAAQVLGSRVDQGTALDELGLDAADLRKLESALAERFPAASPRVDAGGTLAALAGTLTRTARADLADIAHTTQVGREPLAERVAVVATDTADLAAALQAFVAGEADARLHRDSATAGARAPRSDDPHALAAAWAGGAKVTWPRPAGRAPRKVALPLYPFDRVRCWVDVDPPTSTAVPAGTAVPGSIAVPMAEVGGLPVATTDDMEPLVPVWRPAPAGVGRGRPGPVLVLCAPSATALAADLAARLGRATVVELNSATAELPVPGAVYLLAGRPAAGSETARTAEAEVTVRALARLAKQWATAPRVDWVVVTEGALPAPGRPVTQPHTAGLVGFARVLESEFPAWTVPVVDLDPACVDAALVAAEPPARGVRAAYTGRVRHLPALAPAPAAEPGEVLRSGGHYLVIGGARGIGLTVAKSLVDKYSARVTLLGRSTLDDERALAVAALGDRARYLRADAADPAELAAALAEAEIRGPVHGVLHAALVQRDRLVRGLSDEELSASLAAKAGVAAALMDALADPTAGRAPDFVLFFSSAQSFLGDPGLANYAAGSVFLDSYAHALDARLPLRVRSVDWGYWGTVGAVADERHRAGLGAAGFAVITPETGFAALERALRTPAPQVVVVPGTGELRRRMGAGTLTPTQVRAITHYHAADAAMTRLARGALLALFDDMGAWRGADPDAAEVAARIGVTPRYARLLETLLGMLVGAGDLTEVGGRLRPDPAALAGARAGGHLDRLAGLAERHPGAAVFTRLLARCLAAYPALLRGEVQATDLLFPKSGTSLMAGIYRENPVSDVYNDVLADHVAAHVERAITGAGGEPVRVVEVGAGTGGTSAGLLRALDRFADRVEYWYTDLSAAFLAHGRRHFGQGRPYLRFRRLDLDADPLAQGFPGGGFDVVVGANVLHATADLGRASLHLRALLRPGGELVLNELTTVTLQATITYGLFDGWWAHDDTALRLPGSPLLDVPGWDALLRTCGFDGVTAYPTPADTDRNFQHVIAAPATVPTVAAPAREAVGGDTGGIGDTDDLSRRILEITEAASGIPVSELDLDREIGEYGFDSVSYTLLAATLGDRLGVDVTPALFYETATLRDLVARLAAEHPGLPARTTAPMATTPPPVGAPASASTLAPVPAPRPVEAPVIIGMAARLPGSRDLADYFARVVAGEELVGPVPADRWDPGALPAGVIAARGGFIDGVDEFDPLFFGISPHEADGMDPQQRILLEGVWAALEDAGIAPGSLAGSDTGLFIGAGSTDYDEVRRAAGVDVDAHAATATTHSILVNRVSYLLDLHGPSEPVNTGCSSSLVALHRAAVAIRAGECEVAVAGGVNLMLTPHNHTLLSGTGMLSPRGRCRPFDAEADGFVRGEGLGLVVLTTAARARSGGHRVRARLLGTAVNHGGRARSLTAPNPTAQAAVVVRAHEQAGTDPATIGHLQTHGTGTELGDPVEVNGLRSAFDELRSRRGDTAPAAGTTALGAAKANIGHLESAAGVAGVITAVLAMEHATIPPIAGLGRQNPHLRLDGGPFRLPRAAEPWPEGATPRRAAVSSFGYGGVNGHVVIEQGDAPAPGAPLAEPVAFPLSARTARALRRTASALREHVASAEVDLADVAHTLRRGRDAMAHRAVVVAGDRDALLAGLTAVAEGRPVAASGEAARWVAGERVEWTPVGRLASLPTYPFERRRCWVTPSGAETVEPQSFAPRWVLTEEPEPIAADSPLWIVGGGPVADALAAHHRGGAVHRVAAGASTDHLPSPGAVYFVAADSGAVTAQGVAEAERTGVLALFELVKALLARPACAGELALTVVTSGAFPVTGPVTAPASGAVWGLVRSLRAECERWRVAAVDVAPGESAAAIAAAGVGDHALRGGHWYRQELVPVAQPAIALPVRSDGAYVVFGGTGDLGLDAAEWLSAEGAHVVLVGRSAPTGHRADRIAALDRVSVDHADATDPDAVRGVLARAASRGPVRGVVVSVAVDRDRSLAAMDAAWFTEGLATKSRALAAVAEGLAGHAPDFLAAFSSVQSFLGNPGQAAYAAGCAAQDALVHALAERLAHPVRVLDWGAWAGSALAERHRDRVAAAGLRPLPPRAGLDALGRVLGGQEIQVVVVSGDDGFLRRIGVQTGPVPAEPATPTPTPAPGSGFAAPAPATPPVSGFAAPAPVPVAPPAAFGADLLALVREVAGVTAAEMGPDDELRDFGFDSIAYTRLSHRVNARWDIDATPATFFGVATAAELVAKVGADFATELAARYAPEAPAAPQAPAEPATPTPAPAAVVGEGADEAVAIVGMSGVFPGADDVDELWARLAARDDLVSEVPADRWDWKAIDGPAEPGEFRTPARWGGFARRVDLFDAGFFGISPTEATAMDPQHRLALQAVWGAAEDAGIRPSALAGTGTGVFLGCGTYDYFEVQHALGVPVDGYGTVGRAHAILANRVSYLLDLHGSSEAIDTACSSSLVAVHRAAEAIRHGACDLAFAGGVNVIASPTLFVDMAQAGMLSPRGRCRTFDASADGIVRAEGVGVVLLKRLSLAIADGDVIHAVLRGSAVNHGGRTNSLTAPNPVAQTACVVAAHRRAGVDPSTIGYVETHGTGTEIGDPIEVDGLRAAFATRYADLGLPAPERPHVVLGALKSNTGHLEAAAGVAGLIKVLLAMRHRAIPANLHLEEPNPHLRLTGGPLRLPTGTEPWAPVRDGEPLRAGVSSFGLGGVNAHLVVEEFREEPRTGAGPQVFVLSARDGDRLRAAAERLAAWSRTAGVVPAALARTLQDGREVHAHRLAVVADDLVGLADALDTWLAGGSAAGVAAGTGADPTIADLLEDSEGLDYLRAVAASGRLDKLARLWAGGADVDWAALRATDAPRKVPAPTYPFAPTSHWLTPGARFDAVQAQALPGAGQVTAPAPAPAPVPEPASAEPAAVPLAVRGTPEDDVVTRVREVLAAHLGVATSALPADRVLSDAGVDSLALRRLSRRLAADYGVDNVGPRFTTGQTVRAVAKSIVDRLGPLPSTEPAPEPEPAAPRPAPAIAGELDTLLAGLHTGSISVDAALAELRKGADR
ncbi:SDR family NAD(P)-dependent oxidoreductase [Actinokineospora sp. 24-640]